MERSSIWEGLLWSVAAARRIDGTLHTERPYVQRCMNVVLTWLAQSLVVQYFCAFAAVVVDWASTTVTLPTGCDMSRVLLWTSWTWIILRNSHFRINKVPSSDELIKIREMRSSAPRLLFKLALLTIACAFSAMEYCLKYVLLGDVSAFIFSYPNATMRAKWTQAAAVLTDHRMLATPSSFVLAFLCINCIFWEQMETHLISTRKGKESSISQIIADSKNKRIKWTILGAAVIFVVPLLWHQQVWPAVLHVVGCLLLYMPTESKKRDGDEFQTALHCAGMVLVLFVTILVLTEKHAMLMVTQFASVFPYFFMFISSVGDHRCLKLHAEIKMFKHLFGGMALLFVR